jgi:uncharacterized protein YydD (DUF2326 family)
MFLKLLKIENDSEIIREIPFTKGLNLIIDETKTSNLQESGNNVGKTTVLRLIDFCLGGDGENVYKDPEFKEKTNTQIEAFLKDNSVIITLILKKDLDDESSTEIVIRKNFLKRSSKIQEINGEYYNDKDFDLKLKQLIFSSDVEKPTFRQIISKNIRYEKARLENTIKVLHYNTTFEQYEALYFFWFGIDTDTANRKQKLVTSKSTEESILKRLKKEGSLSEINQALSVIDRDIEELNKQKNNFNINDKFEDDLAALNRIRASINVNSTRLNQYRLRKDIILESMQELEKEQANIDINELEEIYKTASSFVPNLHVKFSEMVSFHNGMLEEKIKFVTSELPNINREIILIDERLKSEISKEKVLSEKLKKAGAIQELEELVTKLTAKFEQKGKYEEQQRQWANSTNKLQRIDQELQEINDGIASLDKTLENRISSFNKFFSKISETLYDEQFILSQDKNERAYELKISSIGGNLGTGKKKGQMAAFDIAYILFCDENDIPCLHFILQDQVENIHDNQLTSLASVVKDANIQFILPVLRDKLPKEINVDAYKVISLSQEEKLFKV